MKNVENFKIKRYTQINRNEFQEIRRWITEDFNILKDYNITKNNSVYLLLKKVFFLGETVIGYAIINDYRSLSAEQANNIARGYGVPVEVFRNHDGLYIYDFMIDQGQRKQGLGTWFLKKIKEEYLPDVQLQLRADNSFDPFWMRQGFDYADKETKTMKTGLLSEGRERGN